MIVKVELIFAKTWHMFVKIGPKFSQIAEIWEREPNVDNVWFCERKKEHDLLNFWSVRVASSLSLGGAAGRYRSSSSLDQSYHGKCWSWIFKSDPRCSLVGNSEQDLDGLPPGQHHHAGRHHGDQPVGGQGDPEEGEEQDQQVDRFGLLCQYSNICNRLILWDCFANILTMALMLLTHSPLLPLSSTRPCIVLVFFVYAMTWNQGGIKFEELSST